MQGTQQQLQSYMQGIMRAQPGSVAAQLMQAQLAKMAGVQAGVFPQAAAASGVQQQTLAQEQARKKAVFEAKLNLAQATTKAENIKQKLLVQPDLSPYATPTVNDIYKWMAAALQMVITSTNKDVVEQPLVQYTAAVYFMILRPRDPQQIVSESGVWKSLGRPQYNDAQRSVFLIDLVVFPLYYRLLLDIATNPKDGETMEQQALRLLSLLDEEAKSRFRVTMNKSMIIQNVDQCDVNTQWSAALLQMATTQTPGGTQETIDSLYVTAPTGDAESFDNANLLAPYTSVQTVNCYEGSARGMPVAIATVTTKVQSLGNTVIVYAPFKGITDPAPTISYGDKTKYTLEGAKCIRIGLDSSKPYTVLCYENQQSSGYLSTIPEPGIFYGSYPGSKANPLTGAAVVSSATAAANAAQIAAKATAAAAAGGGSTATGTTGPPPTGAGLETKDIADLIEKGIAAYKGLTGAEQAKVETAVITKLRTALPSLVESNIRVAFVKIKAATAPNSADITVLGATTEQLVFIFEVIKQIKAIQPSATDNTSATGIATKAIEILRAKLGNAGVVGAGLLGTAGGVIGAGLALQAFLASTPAMIAAATTAAAYLLGKRASK
jgi:hypothetical protein